MFSFLKKEPFEVVSCANGTCVALENVKDDVFSAKIMGDGFAVIPDDEMIVSPVTGSVEAVFPTGHAVGLKTKEGIEVLVHIGINTVELDGEGFNVQIKKGQKVKKGQPIVKIDRDMILSKGYDLSTMIIFSSGYEEEVKLDKFDQKVQQGEVLIS